jgi:hypothetical protein
MKWAARAGVHVDRAAYASLIRRHLDPDAELVCVTDPATVPADATPFDLRGANLGHHHGDYSFESILRSYQLSDPVLRRLAQIVREADLDGERFHAPEPPDGVHSRAVHDLL